MPDKNNKNKEVKEVKNTAHNVNPIQWFPGHMAKTRRIIAESLTQVDIVLELLDARAVISSRNPDIKNITSGKPVLTLINKSDLADKRINQKWIEYYKKTGEYAILIDCKSNSGLNNIYSEIKNILSEKIERYKNKGMSGRRISAMILGIPNVGKSTLLNKICGNVKAKVEDRPGVTLRKQWASANIGAGKDIGIDLLDTPGVLWHKFESAKVGLNLAFIGSIKDDILDSVENAVKLCGFLKNKYPEELSVRFKIDIIDIKDRENIDDTKNITEIKRDEYNNYNNYYDHNEYNDYDIFLKIGQKRGYMLPGGEIDEERCAKMILTEFRAGKIGRISLEEPEEAEEM
jgi:ribosome biogenesis GTPase A